MPQTIDRQALERAAISVGIYPGSQAYADLLEVVEAYEAEPPEPAERQS